MVLGERLLSQRAKGGGRAEVGEARQGGGGGGEAGGGWGGE